MRWNKAQFTIGVVAHLLAGGMTLMAFPGGATDLNDQLTIRLYNGTQGTSRLAADRLVQLGTQQEKAGFPARAIAAWLQALEIYRDLKETEAQGLTYDALGKAYAQLGRYVEAEDALRRRLAIARDLKDYQGQIYGFNNLGTLLLGRANILEARKTFAEGLKIAQDVKLTAGEGLSLSNLGLVAYSLGNYDQAIQYYERAKILRGQARDPGEANTLNNLGDAYRALRDYRTALVSYRQALFISEQSVDRPNQFRALEGLTQAFYGLGQNSNASRTLDQRLALALEQKNSRQIISALKSLAQYYRAKKDDAAADGYYQQALAVAREIGDLQEQQGLLTQISTLRSKKFTQQ